MGNVVAVVVLSVVLALLAACGNAAANVAQRVANLQQPAGEDFGWRVVWQLVRSPTWLVGFGGLTSSFIFQALALNYGELSTVEPIVALELPLALIIASFVFSTRLGRREWATIWTMTGGLVLLVAALDPHGGDASGISNVSYLVPGVATAGTILLLYLMSKRGSRVWRTGCLGAAVGTSFGLTATMVKATVEEFSARGIVGVFSTWQTYTVVGFGLLGVLLMQRALSLGPLVAAQPGFTLMDPLVSILWGTLVFNESTRTGPWLILATAAAIAIGASVFVLARSPLLQSATTEEISLSGFAS